MEGRFLIALLLAALAGLSTTVGSLIAVFYRKPGPIFMSIALGFSAGVMVLVSFVELLHEGMESVGFLQAHIAFLAGMGLMLLIDVLISHEYIMERHESKNHGRNKLRKASVLVAIGIAIHNFPEGMVTFAGAMKDIQLGIALAVAIAIHNIPEGIAVAVPVYASTGSVRKSFWWSFLSGVSEPLGALIAALILAQFLNEMVLGWMLSIVGGFMVYISFDELLPVARSYGKEHLAIGGVITGMGIMALSLALLKL
jgi:ZIP family zinc transporter